MFPSIKLSTQLLPSMFNDMQLFIQNSDFFSFIMSKPSCSLSSYNICDILFHLWSSIPNLYSKMLPLVTSGYSFSGSFHNYCPQVVLSNTLLAWPYFTTNDHLAFHASVALMLYKSLLHSLSVSSLNLIQAVLYESTSLVWHRRHCTTRLQDNIAVQCIQCYSSHCQWSGEDILLFLPFKL